MTDIYIDTEFVERGPAEPIRFISIGMAREDGVEYYAITDDPDAIIRALWHEWLRDNVVPSLPVTYDLAAVTERWSVGWGARSSRNGWQWDDEHPDRAAVKPRAQIADEVRDFILCCTKPRLLGWYSSYDHVVLAQLFGSMVQLPPGIPMWTFDLRQEADRLGNPELPEQADGVHNALADARHNRVRHQALKRYEIERVTQQVGDGVMLLAEATPKRGLDDQ